MRILKGIGEFIVGMFVCAVVLVLYAIGIIRFL